MAIKIYCDICKKEQTGVDFTCDVQIQRINIGIDSTTLLETKVPEKILLQFCKTCWDKKIAVLVK